MHRLTAALVAVFFSWFRQYVPDDNNDEGGVLNVSDKMHRLTAALVAVIFSWFRQYVQNDNNDEGGVLTVSDKMHRLTAALVAVFFATLVLVSSSQAGPVPEASR